LYPPTKDDAMHRGIVATFVVAAAVEILSGPAQAVEDGPSISLAKTVYTGHDGGAQCSDAANFAEANQGDPVTYCFTVTNTGTTHLASVIVTDPLVASPPVLISADSTPLAPGAAARYYVDATPPADEADGEADDTFLNVATASGLPVDVTGAPIDGATAVVATSEAVVYPPEVAPVPGVSLVASVYAGHDGGIGCPAADVTQVVAGASITYCFTVTNTGTTHLDQITFSDLGAGGTPVFLGGGALPLAPGATQRYFLDATAPKLPAGGYHLNPKVTATAVDSSGAALAGLSGATGSDGAVIKAPTTPAKVQPKPAPAPAVKPAVTPPKTVTPAKTTAPKQLAYTGWETWLVATAGIGLAAAGWVIVNADPRRRQRAVVPADSRRRHPRPSPRRRSALISAPPDPGFRSGPAPRTLATNSHSGYNS
jgi:uncharacterized repeat protein (TIGR01451 family)